MLSSNDSKVDVALSQLVNTTPSYIGDIHAVTNMLDMITDKIELSEETLDTGVNSFLDVADDLMNMTTANLWGSIMNRTGSGVNKVISTIDRFVEKIATSNVTGAKVHHYAKSNMYLKINPKNNCTEDISFPNKKVSSVPTWAGATADSIVLPCNKETRGVPYSSCIYKDLRGLLPERSAAISSGSTADLNSPVVAMSLYQNKQTPLLEPVTITFELYEAMLNLHPQCSYWNTTASIWSSDGCLMEKYNKDKGIVVCKCTHLTNFAILMSQSVAPEEHMNTLSAITMVGCITSMVFLVLTFAIYIIFWRNVSSEQSVIILNLCIALFLAYLVFLVGVDRTSNIEACTFVAVFLHYIYLVVFCIMLLNGLMLAKYVIKPFNKTPFVKWGLLASYGIAGVIVGVSMGVSNLEGYGSSTFCWLSIHSGLKLAFIIPVAVIVGINSLVIVIVLKQRFTSAGSFIVTDTKEKVMIGLRNICVLTPVMGVTWILGIFSVNEETVVFQYLFTVFNSIQGLLIFVFHCILNKRLKSAMLKAIRNLPTLYDTSLTNKSENPSADSNNAQSLATSSKLQINQKKTSESNSTIV